MLHKLLAFLVCACLLLFFLMAFLKSSYPVPAEEGESMWIGDALWKYRSFETISQSMLILAAVFGIVMLVRDEHNE
ncbi:MAG: hypothetical protein NT067_03735 [Candidatus Diapherotrites archaeon]|nr:hypothetical protein [Candidatus Diapherotrites archaeon]